MSKEKTSIISGFPDWIKGKKCGSCENKISYNDYEEVGFYLNGEKKGKLFVTYYCPHCEDIKTMNWGSEEFTLEKLCSLVIQHSKTMSVAEKEQWERKNSE